MAKRTYKWRARSEKDKVGCMWALIHIFDFRRSQKLLSDRKHGSSRHSVTANARSKPSNFREIHDVINNVNEDGERRVTLGVSSVKTLMEKEMARAQSLKKIPRNQIETLPSEMRSEVHPEKKHKQTRQKLKAVSDLHVNGLRTPGSLKFNGLKSMSSTEGSDTDFDMAAVLVEICRNHMECEHIDCKNKSESCAILNKKLTDLNNYESPLDQMHSYLQKALDDAAEAVIRNKLVDKKDLNGSKAAQSKELMDLLHILKSNKELSLKLLQDPELHIVEYIQHLQKNQGELELESGKLLEEKEVVNKIGGSEHPEEFLSNEQFYRNNRHKAFWKKGKSKGRNPLEESDISQAFSRIVILKPGPARMQGPLVANTSISSPQPNHSLQAQKDGRRVSSHFSLREIKRRMKHVIGENRKGRDLISLDGVLHKDAHVQKDSADADEQLSRKSLLTSLASRNSSEGDYFRLSAAANKMELKNCRFNIKNDVSPSMDASSFYDEAKKHLSEMLHNQNQNDSLPNGQVPKSLARLLSLSEYNLSSPKYSPEKERKLDSPLKEAKLCTLQQFKQDDDDAQGSTQSRRSLESTTCDVSDFVNEQPVDSKVELIHTQVQEATCNEDKIKPEGSREMANTFDIMFLEGCEYMVVSSDSVHSEGHVLNETFKEEHPKQDPLEEKLSLDHPNSPENIIEKSGQSSTVTVTETGSEKAEQQSPISVLEPFFSEDTISPSCKTANHTELTIEHSLIQFKEYDISLVPLSLPNSWSSPDTLEDKKARLAYTKAVLEASGISMEDVSERLYMKDQLLDPSFFYEVRIPSNLTDDPKLLFDCIAEVVIEIQDKYFGFTPWLSSVNHNIRPAPLGVSFIEEVCKLVDSHLRDHFPSTLDEILRKDVEVGTWMNLQTKIESIIIEAWDDILDDLLEEAVFDLWLEI
ncbi:uncharacterized protein [Typha angustifolia]|uniref:uncharacterized protein n=1 Tax=Typha angustifolia TaxID=59011 RepID=UPI003C2B94C8